MRRSIGRTSIRKSTELVTHRKLESEEDLREGQKDIQEESTKIVEHSTEVKEQAGQVSATMEKIEENMLLKEDIDEIEKTNESYVQSFTGEFEENVKKPEQEINQEGEEIKTVAETEREMVNRGIDEIGKNRNIEIGYNITEKFLSNLEGREGVYREISTDTRNILDEKARRIKEAEDEMKRRILRSQLSE